MVALKRDKTEFHIQEEFSLRDYCFEPRLYVCINFLSSVGVFVMKKTFSRDPFFIFASSLSEDKTPL